jgi:hypothetical protein
MIRRLKIAVAAVVLPLALLACVSKEKYNAEVTKYDQPDQTYQQLKTQLTDEIDADQVEIKKLQGQLKVVVKADILFPEAAGNSAPSSGRHWTSSSRYWRS